MRVQGKVFVVTGGGNGIGQEVVLALLARGGHTAAVDLSAEGLERTRELAGGRAGRLTTHVLDVTDRAAVEAARDEVVAEHGHVDGLVNVAGIIQRFVRVVDLPLEEIDRVMKVNFWGVVHTTKAFLPLLLDRPEAALVNVSSMGALAPVPGQTAYGASKAAVKLFTEGLWAELRGTPVAVTVVFPGAVGTEIAQHSGAMVPGAAPDAAAAAARVTSAYDAADRIVVGMEKGEYRVTIGNDARSLDRFARLAPRRATQMIADRMKSLLS